MTYFDMRGPVRKVLPAIIAGLALILAAAFSIGGLNVFGAYIGFGFVPLLVLSIWPRRANTLVSLLFVFSAGLFTDWATGGIIGQWALIFSIVWGVLRPELRNSPFSLVSFFSFWLMTCGVTIVLFLIVGRFVEGGYPDFLSLGRQMLLATLFVPFVLLLHHVISTRLGDDEAWGR